MPITAPVFAGFSSNNIITNTGWGISMVVYKTNVNATYWSLPSFSRWCFSVCSLSTNSSTNTSSSDMVGLIPLSILSFAILFLNFSERSRYRSWTARLSSDFLKAGLVVFAEFSAAWSHNLALAVVLYFAWKGFMTKSSRQSTKSWYCVHSMWESLAIKR